jgi:hypothetical protein
LASVFQAESVHGLVHQSHCPPGIEDLIRRQKIERRSPITIFGESRDFKPQKPPLLRA